MKLVHLDGLNFSRSFVGMWMSEPKPDNIAHLNMAPRNINYSFPYVDVIKWNPKKFLVGSFAYTL